MAKSLRSKPKLRAKSIKRKGEFSNFVDDRNARLAEKTRLNLIKQNEEKMAEANMDTAEAAETETEPAETAPKRLSHSAVQRKKKLRVKSTKNKKLKF